ncbi:MAG: DinB family protein [Bacteriovoracaceae bacterium]|nr:DinB family protein [Bacteroidota bacterium]
MTPLQFQDYAAHQLAPTEPLFLLVPPNQKDWKPTDESFTVGQLMYHMAYALRFNANGIAKNEWALPSLRHVFVTNRRTPSATVQECVDLYRENSKYFLDIFPSMSDEEFQTGELDTLQLGRAPKWKMSLFALEHHLNHKAELFMYLKLMGIKVTSRELYGNIGS